ncbi:hypothetical protein JW979_14310 [bacterium]|nr:hypothetical protein [candidate division CSSED10-310 bacterium]
MTQRSVNLMRLASVIAVFTCYLWTGAISQGSDIEEILSHSAIPDGFEITAVRNDIDEEIILNIRITDLQFNLKQYDQDIYTVIEIPESGQTADPGRPVLPIIGQVYHISDTMDPEVSLRIIDSHTVTIPDDIIPCQEDLEISDILHIQDVDRTLYSQDKWYPESRIAVYDPVVLRDIRLLPIAFYPISYNAQMNTLDIIEEAELVIHLYDRESINTLNEHGPFSPTWENFYRAVTPNYCDAWTQNRDKNVAEHYLLIMPDAFESRCQGFIAWKEQQGFIVDILRLSEVGSSPTHTSVKQAISARYYSDERPVYASIIGNTNNFPIHESYDSYHPGNYDDDLYYSQLSLVEDLFPDIFLSRYPVVDQEELSTMMSKILYYEQTPNMVDTGYYKTAMMAANSAYPSQQQTKEQTRERLETNLSYDTVHTMYSWSSSSVPQMISWITQGVSIINYRGEGWQSGWYPGGQHFYYDNVYGINNTDKLPVITSIGCGVAMFDGYTDCFGHAWVTSGNQQNLKGAVAFMGPTWNTRTTINNWIDRGIYRGFCYHDITRSSPVFNYGKIYAYNHFLGTQYMNNDIPTHLKEYVLFGNPDLWWRTDIPMQATVRHAWPQSSDRDGIVVINEKGQKLPNAQVCFLKDNERRVYVTDSGGGCVVYMNDVTEPLNYTLTGWNLVPCFGDFVLPETGDDGDLIITEIKPDIPTTGTSGDLVEIANLELEQAVNLKGWTIGDLDSYDLPFIEQDAVLSPQSLAVVEFVGHEGLETVTQTDYGLYITSRAVIGLSSEEDTAVLRNTTGRIRDAICWHNGTGIGSTNEASDMSKLTLPNSPLSMGFRGWWTGSDEITQESYESYAIDWSTYAGNGGPGSIQRIGIPGSGIYDSPEYFTVSSITTFGSYDFPSKSDSIKPVENIQQHLEQLN